jgi:hypothetical protein
MRLPNRNPRITQLLQSVTAIEVLVLLGSGGGLFFLPTVLSEVWPWVITPFDMATVGAGYLSAMVTAAMLILIGRWSPARLVVPMILIFTALILLLSFIYLDRFNLGSPFTWLWFLLYIAVPINAAYHLWLYRKLPPASDSRLGPVWRMVLLCQAILTGLYGLGLLLAPLTFSAFWPWPVDEFHARFYSAGFLTGGLGSFLLAHSATRDEVLTLGLTQIVAGIFPILGLLKTEGMMGGIVWSAPATWLWLSLFAGITVTGVGLLLSLPGLPRLAKRWNEAGFVMNSRVFALFLGVAFTFAGIGGFVPSITFLPPDGAPPLVVMQNYGYLVGLFPVNIIHSLFHLSVGLLGLAAYFSMGTARAYIRVFAVTLALLTGIGMMPGLNTLFGLAPVFGHDIWLHGVEAAAAAYIGFVMPVQPATPRDPNWHTDPRPAKATRWSVRSN